MKPPALAVLPRKDISGRKRSRRPHNPLSLVFVLTSTRPLKIMHRRIVCLLGYVALDMARPKAALAAYQQALRVRQELDGPNSPPIADVYDSIACSYTEQGNVGGVFEYLSKAVEIHNSNDPLQMGRTKAIYAMMHLRAEQPEEPLAALQRCWQLQGMTTRTNHPVQEPTHL